jgi:hypothetical protein
MKMREISGEMGDRDLMPDEEIDASSINYNSIMHGNKKNLLNNTEDEGLDISTCLETESINFEGIQA